LASPTFDLQGHRGARGLAPENTLSGFALALDLGVTTLETDLGVTRDGVVVLSHDRRLDPAITRGPDGAWLRGPTPLIRDLKWNELQAFDVGCIDPGSAYAARFPGQAPADGSRVPSLSQLFEHGEARGRRPRYNIETKLSPLHPGDTLEPDAFVERVLAVISVFGVAERVTIQSFDWRTLLISKRLAPEIATVGLTIDTDEESTIRGAVGGSGPSPWLAGIDAERTGAAVPELVKAAGCAMWSPYWRNLDPLSVRQAHDLGLAVLPWTVNSAADMEALMAIGVDGLITDYPDVAGRVVRAHTGSICVQK